MNETGFIVISNISRKEIGRIEWDGEKLTPMSAPAELFLESTLRGGMTETEWVSKYRSWTNGYTFTELI